MSLPWFRLYSELKDDPKMSDLDDATFRVFIDSLCWASQVGSDGSLGFGIDKANWAFRRDVKASIQTLINSGLLCEKRKVLIVTKWNERQCRSDSSAKRVAKYRERINSVGSQGDIERARGLVFKRDGMACVYCGSDENLCLDHLIPLMKGGTHDEWNLVLACKKCNSGKSGRTPEEAGYSFQNKSAEQMYVTVTKIKCNGYSNGLDKIRGDKIRLDENREEITSVSDKPKSANSRGILSDEAFISELKTMKAYAGIDIDTQLSRMDAWLMTPKGKGRSKTRGFVVNWLNKIDKPMARNGNSCGPKVRNIENGLGL